MIWARAMSKLVFHSQSFNLFRATWKIIPLEIKTQILKVREILEKVSLTVKPALVFYCIFFLQFVASLILYILGDAGTVSRGRTKLRDKSFQERPVVLPNSHRLLLIEGQNHDQFPVQRADNSIQCINRYPGSKMYSNQCILSTG